MSLVTRIAQELPLILLVAAGVVLLAAVLSAWRVRTGTAWMPALVTSSLEAGIVGALVGIATLTLGPFMSTGIGPANLFPFQSLLESFRFGPYWTELVLVDLAANFLLYLPLGLLVALRFPQLSFGRWLLAVLALTGGIEIIQGAVLNRSADITDVVMNAAGGVAGFGAGRAVQSLATPRHRIGGPGRTPRDISS